MPSEESTTASPKIYTITFFQQGRAMHVEEYFCSCSACDQSVQRAGITSSPQSRFFRCDHCVVVVLALQLVPAGHGASGNPVLQFCWCWIAWEERDLACVAVSSPHGQLSCPGAHWMKVNIKTLCWAAKFRSGGKPQGSLVFDKADVDGTMLRDCTGAGAEGHGRSLWAAKPACACPRVPPHRGNHWNHPETLRGKWLETRNWALISKEFIYYWAFIIKCILYFKRLVW